VKKVIGFVTALQLASLLFAVDQAAAQGTGGDMLNEVPIWPVPAEMTFEEYTDANRRLGVGLLLMSVPLPGTVHFYAGESRAGWKHVGAAALGLVSIIAGAAIVDEKDNQWRKTDLETIDITGDNGTVERYEKIPVEEEAGALNYRLQKLDHKTKGGGGIALIAVGAGLVVGQVLHDLIQGTKTIQRKRDAVRYKYGQSSGYKFSVVPNADLERRSLGAQLSMCF
jgi:hypothetical protein